MKADSRGAVVKVSDAGKRLRRLADVECVGRLASGRLQPEMIVVFSSQFSLQT
jgi:hypothetical protein